MEDDKKNPHRSFARATEDETNIHAGHRLRMYHMLECGIPLTEYQCVEVLLFDALPRVDTNIIAHRLVDRFGSLEGVLSATEEELLSIRGIGKSTVEYLHNMRDELIKIYNDDGANRLDSFDKFYCFCTGLKNNPKYQVCIFNNRWQLELITELELNIDCEFVIRDLMPQYKIDRQYLYFMLFATTEADEIPNSIVNAFDYFFRTFHKEGYHSLGMIIWHKGTLKYCNCYSPDVKYETLSGMIKSSFELTEDKFEHMPFILLNDAKRREKLNTISVEDYCKSIEDKIAQLDVADPLHNELLDALMQIKLLRHIQDI